MVDGVNKKRLFVDMDGTLAVFKVVDTLEKLYEENYFLGLEPQLNVVKAVDKISRGSPEMEVYILSSVLSDSKYALKEKNEWLDKYLPFIDCNHRLFPTCGEDKSKFICSKLGNINEQDFLLDDYSLNLHAWDPPARGIKLMNGINGNYGTWIKDKVDFDTPPDVLADNITSIMECSCNSLYDSVGDEIVHCRRVGR
jgi:5'(3')-deoxyribonucleotidase